MPTRTQGTLLAGLLLALAAAAPTAGGNPAMTLRLHSTAFSDHGEIPSRYTCEGANVSPPLDWSGVPAGARSLALVVEDPDAPDPAAPRMTWTHWLLYDLPAGTGALPEGATAAQLPAGTRVGNNDFRHAAYGGPCPPIGRHRYVHRLYALDTTLPDLGHPSRAALLKAIEGHVLARTELVGTYQKHGH